MKEDCDFKINLIEKKDYCMIFKYQIYQEICNNCQMFKERPKKDITEKLNIGELM